MEHYGELLVSNIENADANKMSYADYTSAHFMAYIHKIVGRNSIFKREADRVFHLKGIFQHCTPEKASEDGFRMNDELAMAIHKKYKEGKYSLPQKEVSEFVLFLRTYFKNEQKIALESNEPISYLQKDNFSPAYKSDKDEIRKYLQANGSKFPILG